MTRLGSALLAGLLLTLAFAATAQADIRMHAVRSIDALEGELAPRDRIVEWDDAGTCNRAAYAVTITWGDGAQSTGTVDTTELILGTGLEPTRCVYTAYGMHTYNAPGTFALSARVCRAAECRDTAAGGVARVAGAPFEAESERLALAGGSPFTGRVARFRSENRSAQASQYTSVVDWGDGTSTPGTVSGDQGRLEVTGSHTYGAGGSFPLTVRLLKGDSVVGTATGTADVAGAAAAALAGTAAPFRATAGTPFSREIAAFGDASPLANLAGYQATVDWGDGTVSAGNVVAGLAVAGGHTYARVGSYAVRVTLQRPGASGVVATTATVDAGARPTLRIRGSRTLSRRALRRGLPVRVAVPANVRSLRVAIVRAGSRVRTLGTVRVAVRGSVANGVRTANLRVRPSAALLRRMRAGSYALQFRVAGSGLISTQFRVR